MFRLLATDIDGTLLGPDGSLPSQNIVALRALHDAGITIVFCSGRSDISIRGIAAPILPPADDAYYIAFNGARIVTAGSRQMLSHRYVTPPAIRQVVHYAREHGLYIQGYRDDIFLVEKKTDFTDRYAHDTQTRYEVVPDLIEALPHGSPKLFFAATHEQLVPHRTQLLAMGEIDSPDGFTAMFSKPHYLEVIGWMVNKGDALAELAGTLGVPIGETLAVGDGDNDTDMIRAAGTGVAVNGSSAGATQAADQVLTSRAEDGVMKEVAERFFGLRA